MLQANLLPLPIIIGMQPVNGGRYGHVAGFVSAGGETDPSVLSRLVTKSSRGWGRWLASGTAMTCPAAGVTGVCPLRRGCDREVG